MHVLHHLERRLGPIPNSACFRYHRRFARHARGTGIHCRRQHLRQPGIREGTRPAIREAGIRKRYITYGRSDQIVRSPGLFALWKEIGLERLTIGVESVDDAILESMNKKATADIHRQALRIVRDLGIQSVPHFLVTPDMDQADLDRIKAFISEEKITFPAIIPLTPVPGTEDFERYRQEGRLLTLDQRFYTFAFNVVQPKHGSVSDYDRRYDALSRWVWSWERYRHDRCGGMALGKFLGRWLMVRIYLASLRKGRKALTRNSRALPKANPFPNASLAAPFQ